MATDRDGDQITIDTGSLIITVENDVPVQTTTIVTSAVQEDALIGGNSSGEGTKSSVATGSLSALASAGADEPLSWSVQSSGTLPTLFSKGEAVTYSFSDTNSDGTLDTVQAKAGTRDIFTLSLNTTTGGYTYTLLDQLDHNTGSLTIGTGDSQTLTLDLSGSLVATDKDGDKITIDTGSLIITCLLYTSPSPRDGLLSRMPSSA